MVREKVYFVFILTFLPLFLASASFHAEITAEIDLTEQKVEDKELLGTITILHSVKNPVAKDTFTLGGSPLTVEFVKEVKPSSSDDLILSIYRFRLPGKKAGLYELPEIHVKVGGQRLASIPSTFEVLKVAKKEVKKPQMQALKEEPVKASLKLEAYVLGQKVLYVGQRTTLVTRFTYTGSIQLSKEELPLLDPKGLLVVGQPIVEELQEGEASIKQFSVTVEAKDPGVYVLGPSIIEGVSTDSHDKVASKTDPITITVKAIPIEKAPISYTGAVGKYTFSAKLRGSSEVSLGQKIALEITIGGNALENLQLPDYCCLPGMSGLFSVDDLPPSGLITGDQKQFTLYLEPISSFVKEIPQLEFTYFNVESGTFQTLKSLPIPLKVKEEKVKKVPEKRTILPVDKAIKPIQIEGNYTLSNEDLLPLWFATWKVFAALPFAALITLYQVRLKEQKEFQKKQSETSLQLLEKAYLYPENSGQMIEALKKAFLRLLKEKNEIDSEDISLEALPNTDLAKQVVDFFKMIESAAYSKEKSKTISEITTASKNLYKELSEK